MPRYFLSILVETKKTNQYFHLFPGIHTRDPQKAIQQEFKDKTDTVRARQRQILTRCRVEEKPRGSQQGGGTSHRAGV